MIRWDTFDSPFKLEDIDLKNETGDKRIVESLGSSSIMTVFQTVIDESSPSGELSYPKSMLFKQTGELSTYYDEEYTTPPDFSSNQRFLYHFGSDNYLIKNLGTGKL